MCFCCSYDTLASWATNLKTSIREANKMLWLSVEAAAVVAISQGLQWCISDVKAAAVQQQQFSIRSVSWFVVLFLQAYPQVQFSSSLNSL